MVRSGWQLIVEIRVTHEVSKEKLDKIVEKQISAIEFDFCQANRYVTKNILRNTLLKKHGKTGLGRCNWLFHIDKDKTIRKLTKQYRIKHLSKKKDEQLSLF